MALCYSIIRNPSGVHIYLRISLWRQTRTDARGGGAFDICRVNHRGNLQRPHLYILLYLGVVSRIKRIVSVGYAFVVHANLLQCFSSKKTPRLLIFKSFEVFANRDHYIHDRENWLYFYTNMYLNFQIKWNFTF